MDSGFFCWSFSGRSACQDHTGDSHPNEFCGVIKTAGRKAQEENTRVSICLRHMETKPNRKIRYIQYRILLINIFDYSLVCK